jgi:hypothetical protein
MDVAQIVRAVKRRNAVTFFVLRGCRELCETLLLEIPLVIDEHLRVEDWIDIISKDEYARYFTER